MQPDQINPASAPDETPFPPADYGNASNPSPHHTHNQAGENQLLGKEAEKYLREVANIEDVPDAQDQAEMDETIEQDPATKKATP